MTIIGALSLFQGNFENLCAFFLDSCGKSVINICLVKKSTKSLQMLTDSRKKQKNEVVKWDS
jgi:hypothetical protein